MEEETKKPYTPVEEAGRDYNELGLYLHGETAKTATELWEMLDREDSDAECMALDLRTKLEWIASVLEIAEENEGLGA